MSEYDDTIKIACPNCGAIFDIPIEYCGQLGECTECDVVFEIPTLEGEAEEEVEITETGSIKIEDFRDADDTDTNTVKLSRDTIGMIPDIQSQFKIDVVTQDKKSVDSSTNISPGSFNGQAANNQPAPTTKKKVTKKSQKSKSKKSHAHDKSKKKWWQFWK